MKRMIHPNETGESALRLELGRDRFERKARTRKRDRTRTVEGGNRDGAIVPRDECEGFLFRQTDGEHGAFAASAFLH